MPIELNRINRECTKCKNATIFNVAGKSYFCGNCMTEFNMDMTVKNETVIEEQVPEIVKEAQDVLMEIKILEKKQPVEQNTTSDIILDPDILVIEQNAKTG